MDGKSLQDEQLKLVDYDFYPQICGSSRKLTLGEIGCAMSHIKVYQKIIDEKIEIAIILEDDAIVSNHFLLIVNDIIRKITKRAEICFLDHDKAKSWLLKRMLIQRYKLARYVTPRKKSKRCIICATAYFLTLSGAQKLLDKAYPIRMPADYLTGMLQLTGVHGYGVEPPCVFKGVDSEIDAIEQR